MKYYTVDLNGDIKETLQKNCSLRIVKKEKLSVAQTTTEEEQVRAAEGLEGVKCDLCRGLVHEGETKRCQFYMGSIEDKVEKRARGIR